MQLAGYKANTVFDMNDCTIYLANDNEHYEDFIRQSHKKIYFRGELTVGQFSANYNARCFVIDFLNLDKGFANINYEQTRIEVPWIPGYLKNPFTDNYRKFEMKSDLSRYMIKDVNNDEELHQDEIKPIYEDYVDYFKNLKPYILDIYKDYVLASYFPLNELLLPYLYEILNIIEEKRFLDKKIIYISIEEFAIDKIKYMLQKAGLRREIFDLAENRKNGTPVEEDDDDDYIDFRTDEQKEKQLSDKEREILVSDFNLPELYKIGIDLNVLQLIYKNMDDFLANKQQYFEPNNIKDRIEKLRNLPPSSFITCDSMTTFILLKNGLNLMRIFTNYFREECFIDKYQLYELVKKNFRQITIPEIFNKSTDNKLPKKKFNDRIRPKKFGSSSYGINFKVKNTILTDKSNDSEGSVHSRSRGDSETFNDIIPQVLNPGIVFAEGTLVLTTDDLPQSEYFRYVPKKFEKEDVIEQRKKEIYKYNHYISISDEKGRVKVNILSYSGLLISMIMGKKNFYDWDEKLLEKLINIMRANVPIISNLEDDLLNPDFSVPYLVLIR